MLYSTLLGGTGGDMLQGLALDQYGRVYATGVTSSSDFPIKSAPGLLQDAWRRQRGRFCFRPELYGPPN